MKVYHKKLGESFHIKTQNEVFLSFDIDGEGVAILASLRDFTETKLKEELKKLGFDYNKISLVKLVTSESAKEHLSFILKKFKEIKFVERIADFELYFIPSGHKVRIAKEENSKVKVLIIDDSKTICRFLEKIISVDSRIEVVGIVNNPLEAEKEIAQKKPDVITLDIHMPHMNGVELIKKIHPKFHIPTIMISSISIQEGPLVMEALESGAVDYIQKPEVSNLSQVSEEINEKIIQASKVLRSAQKQSHLSLAETSKFSSLKDKLIVIGSSTGGTKALREILVRLPKEIPPILIVQHIPEVFSRAFAERLNEQCPFEVKEASLGDKIEPNKVYIAQGGKQMKVKKSSQGGYEIDINMDEPVNRFRPSVDYLFETVSKTVDDKTILAVILTGMGNDGAQGMKKLKEIKNAHTIAQDEKSSVVFGMPKEAIKLGCVDKVLDLDEIPRIMVSIFN